MILSGCGSYNKDTYNYDALNNREFVDGLTKFQMLEEMVFCCAGDKAISITHSLYICDFENIMLYLT